MRTGEVVFGAGTIALFGIVVLAIAGWIRHILWTIGLLASGDSVSLGQGILAVIGALAAPIGSLHGVALLFGFSWQ